MRILLILRGAPGAGKSTWVEKHHLEQFTLCPDNLRVLCSSRELKADGSFTIARNKDTEAITWKVLSDLLEYRMSKGEFTVIDATASKTKDMQQYKALADQYRYRIYCVDFTDVPLKTCLAQNKMRPTYKVVPEEAIKKIYARFATQKVPSGIEIIKPTDFDSILEKPIDLSNYKKIVFIGDIHGCYDTLMQYKDFKDVLDPEVEYIFCGDFVDRGNQNAEVLSFIESIMDNPNVCLIEGNHEHWIRDYGNSIPAKSKEFETVTKPQLIQAGFSEKSARMLYRKVRQFSHFTYNGLEVFACHGGIPFLDINPLYIPTESFIKGVGDYRDYKTIAGTWMSQTKENQFLVHGHRNTENDETQIADRVFNLEGRVEFGGKLRIIELTNDLKWNVVELDACQPIDETLNTEEYSIDTVEHAVAYLRNNKFVQEKQLGANISSFNFTREAFFKGNWTKQTVLARGLFIDTKNNQIMARSYEKFFRINEVLETELNTLKERLQFPVTAYVKENGFLGIVSYDYINDDLFIASKSTNRGDFVEYLKAQLKPYREKLLATLRKSYKDNNGVSMTSYVFECEDIENDPHIIKYSKNNIVLLDIIYNTLQFSAAPYSVLVEAARELGCLVKEKAFILEDWNSFKDFYLKIQSEDYMYNGRYIEGFVFTDSAGFMTKCKTGYYNLWKKLRGIANQTLSQGYILKTDLLTSGIEELFYKFCKDLYQRDRDPETKTYPYKTDIISLRDMFYKKWGFYMTNIMGR